MVKTKSVFLHIHENDVLLVVLNESLLPSLQSGHRMNECESEYR